MTKQNLKTRDRAIALQYADREELPTVIANGAGELARQILKLAQEHNIPVKDNQALVDMLAKLPVGETISAESFQLVAEIVSFLYHTDIEWQAKHAFLEPVFE